MINCSFLQLKLLVLQFREITLMNMSCLQTSRLDVGNFDKEFTSKEPKLSVIDPSIVCKINQDEFRDFSFVNNDYERHDDSVSASVSCSSSETMNASDLIASSIAAASTLTSLS